MEHGKVKRLIELFQNEQRISPIYSVQYRTKAVRALMRRNKLVFNALHGSSDGSGQAAYSDDNIGEQGARRMSRSRDDVSEFSKCSAGVQTEPPLNGSAQKRDTDLLHLFRRIEQFLVAQSNRTQEAIHSLDRVSSKAGKTSQRTSDSVHLTATSLQCSPKRTNRDLDARASSTPISDNQNSKTLSEDPSARNSGTISDRNSSFSAVPLPPTSAQETESKHSEPQETQKLTKNPYKDSETQMGVTLQQCICSHPEAPHVDQGTQMSFRQYPIHSSPRSLTLCQCCKKRPCVCKLAHSVMSTLKDPCSRCKKSQCTCYLPKSGLNDHCLHCRKMPCACEPTNSARSFKSVECGNCKKKPCVCQLTHSTRSHTKDDCVNCKMKPCVCRQTQTARSLKTAEREKCVNCKMVSCSCRKSNKSGSSTNQMKIIDGNVFGTFLDIDFSSSEAMPSSTSTSDKVTSTDGTKMKSTQCSVCRCESSKIQSCVYCVCHLDKIHIPRCDCHNQIPRFLIPGFCKCHRRNLRTFDKCRCLVETEMIDGVCPCCNYYALRMRAQMLETMLQKKQPSVKTKEVSQPKNYFLKLEETEVSKDSSEASEQEKQPLEVVTIKIPVKRMGRAKVPMPHQFYYGGDSKKVPTDSRSSRPTNVATDSRGSRTESSRRRVEQDIEFLDDIMKKYMLSSPRTDSQSRCTKDEGTSSRRRDLTRSERESGKSSATYRTLQECLESNRPDFFSSAEYRRKVIGEKARDRELRKQKMMPHFPSATTTQNQGSKRIFSTAQIHAQTRKKCKQLSEVTQKKEDRKKRESYQTNKIMAEIFAKRLQLKTLRGQLNISNSCNLLAA